MDNDVLILDIILRMNKGFNQAELSAVLTKFGSQFESDLEYLSSTLIEYRLRGYLKLEDGVYSLTDEGYAEVLARDSELIREPDYKKFIKKINSVIK